MLANLIDLVFNLNNIQVILQTLFITRIKKDYYEGINNGGQAMRQIVYAIKSHFKIYEKNAVFSKKETNQKKKTCLSKYFNFLEDFITTMERIIKNNHVSYL